MRKMNDVCEKYRVKRRGKKNSTLEILYSNYNTRARNKSLRVCVRSVNKFVCRMCSGFLRTMCIRMVLIVCMGCILFYLHTFCMKVAKAHTIFSSVQNMEGKMHKVRIVFRFVGENVHIKNYYLMSGDLYSNFIIPTKCHNVFLKFSTTIVRPSHLHALQDPRNSTLVC